MATCEHGMPLTLGCDDCTIARLNKQRQDDEALILQLVEALECHCEMTRSLVRSELAITAGRARLAPPPPTA
ncbi:hypothetical protein ACOYR4_13190 [Acidovorax sp. M14]|uniref:hypothetical protein n=1 Tax=Acidovorax sp. M14 TaxID=3411354 RepID=UPI003BF61CA5